MYHCPDADYTKFLKICAARRALGIVNRLRPGRFRAHHNRRVMINLNRLRAV